MSDSHRLVALIPARGGSKRLPGKNTRQLAGHPLLSYAIAAAQESELFARIVVSTDSDEATEIAVAYGAETILRPPAMATDYSPDIEWVNHAMAACRDWVRSPRPPWYSRTIYQPATEPETFDAFAIIRPTSPFRRGAWLRAAWEKLLAEPRADSIRAVKPDGALGKLFVCSGEFLIPIAPYRSEAAPWHSMPSQETPQGWRQTAALEIAWTRVLPESISGQIMLRYLTEPDAPEALDLNTQSDWDLIEQVAKDHLEYLPTPRRVVGL